ncbi:hypothetical protein [Fluoribacter gormanii]|uniref:hypothetical protein n=1 Tax=Fluoribacter gormanii TaxID=464 RepID=UPI001041B065|nr:hypothetical protein [Fluoribacter gormanii]
MTPIDVPVIIMLALFIMLLFSKKIIKGLKKINRYTWLIIVCYLSGTLTMEYQTYKFSVPLEGVFMTFPLVMAFIYWSYKNNKIFLLNSSVMTKKEAFKTDLFLISTSFLLAGFLSLMMDLNNSDLRAFWPFLIFFISIYGFVFSLIYALLGLFLNENHKKYTLFFASAIMLIYSLLSFFPRKIGLLNSAEIEIIYALPIILLFLHLVFIVGFQIKRRQLKN